MLSLQHALPAPCFLPPFPTPSSQLHPSPLHDTANTHALATFHTYKPTARSLDSYHEILYKRLDKLLNVTHPRKSVMLAIDGPAPLAKLMTQRDRRKVCVESLWGCLCAGVWVCWCL